MYAESHDQHHKENPRERIRMLKHEEYTKLEERFNHGVCRATRLECGIEEEPGLDCMDEPCRVVCPFTKLVLI